MSEETENETIDSRRVPRWFAPVSVTAGLVFLTAILAAAIFIPNPTPFQIFVFRVVIALAAAAFGATIPGFLNIDMPLWGKGVVAAGGALGLFVIVFQINPPMLANDLMAEENLLRHIDLDKKNHIGLRLPDCESSNTDMENFLFDSAVLYNCNFSNASISKIRFNDANVSASNFSDAEAYGASFENAGAVGTNFTKAILVGAIFRGSDLNGAQFYGAKLADADFREADLKDTALNGADISGADFRGSLNLTQAQINTAFYDPKFRVPLRLPNGMDPPPETMERPFQ